MNGFLLRAINLIIIMATVLSCQRARTIGIIRSPIFAHALTTFNRPTATTTTSARASARASFYGNAHNSKEVPFGIHPMFRSRFLEYSTSFLILHHPTRHSHIRSPSTKLYSSTAETETAITLENLPQTLRKSYLEGETDAIMKLLPHLIHSFSGDDLITAALDAARNSKGQAASILNAIIASCTCVDTGSQSGSTAEEINVQELAPALAWDIYTTWEELADEIDLFPDMVTFCCTYTSVHKASTTTTTTTIHDPDDVEYFKHCAAEVMDRAQRYSKKIAGSKRRKLLNSISRRGGGGGGKQDKKKGKDEGGPIHEKFRAMDHLQQLQESYGQDFDILFEDDDVVVVNKPSGMVVFHSKKTTDGKVGRKKKVRVSKKNKKKGKKTDDETVGASGNDSDISLEDALIDVGLSLSTLNSDALGVVHRIDRGTSGCIVLAKNDDAHARLVTSFFTRRAKKRYTAIVPYLPTSISKDDDETTNTSNNLEPSGEIELEVGGRPAKSMYTVEREFGKAAIQLGIQTQTGRKHQVRIHCSKALGRPILLDPLYSEHDTSNGPKKGIRKNEDDSSEENDAVSKTIESASDVVHGRQFFLHASSLSIEEFAFVAEAPLPSWWLPILDGFERKSVEVS